MIRKLVVAMAAAGAIGANSALALGLGDITLNSALNQPLDAEIELLEVRDLASNEMLPGLAGRDDFIRAGVERAFFLTDLKFKTVQRANGSAYVKVTSDSPVREPFLNFLMEVQWPSGRLLREYTLLLDPPAFAETQSRRASLISTPVSQSGVTAVSGDRYEVQANDSLWRIAASARPDSSVTVQQTMLAIQELNPDAFINGNINLLRKGAVLRLPSADQVRQRSQGQAVSEVAQQNESWQGQAIDARVRDAAKPALPSDEGDGRLSILNAAAEQEGSASKSAGEATEGAASSAELESLQNELAISLENLDKVSRESDELKDRLGELEQQISTLEQLVTLKDDQLAQLQGQLAAGAEDEGAAADAGVIEAAAAPVVEEAPLELTEDADTAVAEAPAVETSDVAAVETAPVAEVAEPVVAEAVTLEPVEVKAPVAEPKPQPIVAEPQPEETGFFDAINPLYLAGGGAAILLLALLLVRARRKSGDEVEEEVAAPLLATEAPAEEPEEALLPDDEAAFEPIVEAEADLSELDELERQLQLDASLEEPVAEAAQASDPLKEADVYVAYGRHSQADELLQKAIAAEPGRVDLRLKQLEVLAAMGDADAFSAAAGDFEPMADLDAQMRINELRESLGGDLAGDEVDALDAELDALDFDLGDAGEEAKSAEEPAEPELEAGAGADDELLDFDLSDAFDESEAPREPAAEAEPAVELGLEDELSLSELDAETGEADELDFEFDLAEDEAAVSGESEEEALAALDDEFDLSLNEPEEAAVAESLTETSAEEDELLAFDASLDEELALEDELELDEEFGLDQPLSSADEEFDLSLTEEAVEGAAAEAEESAGFAETLDEALTLDDAALGETVADDLDQALELDAELGEDLSLDEAAMTEAGLEADLEELEEMAFDAVDESETMAPVGADDTLAADEDLEDLESLAALDDEAAAAEFEIGDDDDFDLLGGTDEASTKLDLARAYIDMEDVEGAREILEEVISEGTEEQKQDAQELLTKLG